jgi:hypothetical protein
LWRQPHRRTIATDTTFGCTIKISQQAAVLLFHRRQPKEEPKYTAVLFCSAGGVLGVPSTPLCRLCAFAVKNGRSSATYLCLGTLPKFLKYTTPPQGVLCFPIFSQAQTHTVFSPFRFIWPSCVIVSVSFFAKG